MASRNLSSLLSALILLLLTATSVNAFNIRDFRFARDQKEPLRSRAAGDKYLIGVGKADITGPVVEVGFAGYADLAQTGTGLRQRLYSRAFLVGDVNSPDDRFIYLILDTQSGDTAVRRGILEGVSALGSEYSVYSGHNIAVTGTHSHAGPAGWFNYLLPQITSLGFDKQSYQAIVDGAVLSIKRAHENIQEVI
jgi:neutral ceramidase